MICFYIFLFLLNLYNSYGYKCSPDKIFDLQLRTCVDKSLYSKTDITYFDINLGNGIRSIDNFMINNTYHSCIKNFTFNGISCKLINKDKNFNPVVSICNLKKLTNFTNLPNDVCNYYVIDSYDINDKLDLILLNFWQNSTEATQILYNFHKIINFELVKGIYVSIGKNIPYWNNLLTTNDVQNIYNKLLEFKNKYNISGFVLRHVNNKKLLDLVDKLYSNNVNLMLNINSSELLDSNILKDISTKVSYVNILYDKEKDANNMIKPYFTETGIREIIKNINKLNINKNKVSIVYSLLGKLFEVTDYYSKELYMHRNVSLIYHTNNIKMFDREESIIRINDICNNDTNICNKEDLVDKTNKSIPISPPSCLYSIKNSNELGAWVVYQNKIVNFLDSIDFYKLNKILRMNKINTVFIDSLDYDFQTCKKFPQYYYTRLIMKSNYLRKNNLITQINNENKTSLYKPCNDNVTCTSTGFKPFTCDKQKYIKCVKMNQNIYKYVFSCKKNYVFNPVTNKCKYLRN